MSASPQRAAALHKATLDGWQADDIASKYARGEAATRPYADIFLDKCDVANLSTEMHALDLGCGTGAVIAALYAKVPREKWGLVRVLGGDISESMLKWAKERGEREGWGGLRVERVDAGDIQLPHRTFTHVFANAIIFHFPPGVLKSCFDLLKPGGFVGVTTWAQLPWYEMVKRAVGNLPTPPELPSYKEIVARIQQDRPWNDASYVEEQLRGAGFVDVSTVQERKKVPCGTPAQFVEGMTMPMTLIAAWWDEKDRERLLKEVLGELRKEAVKEAGGEESIVYMNMEGIVGVGWKKE